MPCLRSWRAISSFIVKIFQDCMSKMSPGSFMCSQVGILECDYITGHFVYQWINPCMNSELKVLLGSGTWSKRVRHWECDL